MSYVLRGTSIDPGKEGGYLSCVMLLGWALVNAGPELPSSVGWGDIRCPTVVLFL